MPITTLPFVDRAPTAQEIERIRLILSTYQDGSGMLVKKVREVESGTLPGWRDFERTVAAALSGVASESKALFDVILERPSAAPTDPKYGLSCKMRAEYNRVARDGRVTIEVSNAAGDFWAYLGKFGLNPTNYREKPDEVGQRLIEVVNSWHQSAGQRVDLTKSFYLVLLYNLKGFYRLYQYKLDIVDPAALKWSFPPPTRASSAGNRLCGNDGSGNLVEWYGESGGQLKFFPHESTALWKSDAFVLEPLPPSRYGIVNKVSAYYPDLWGAAIKDEA